jgi:uncharacterized protein
MQRKSNPGNVLFGKTRRGILSLLYSHIDEEYYLRQIARVTGIGIGPVQRELKQLTDSGITLRKVQCRQVYYQANSQSPVFNELKSLMQKMSLPGLTEAEGETLPDSRIGTTPDKLAEFCQKHHISKLSFFGSVLRDDFRPDSDVDVLVEFEPGHVPGFAIIDIQGELSRMLKRKVDMRTPRDLSRYFREKVVREARVGYAATK